ncbi:MAG: hypothetical protein CVT79_04035 [Alphaproteobacteria bacterium HGW-Alphaproteobacteria-18]|nr:MAG: hypothetical protein CVT79_04035 [Alphaproteobacteria bacterium HGW-Alphaproteobacteria-18]
MRILFGLAALFFLALPAQAEFVIAKCTMAGGCQCRLADLTIADMEMITGEKMPKGAKDQTMVMVPGRDPYWTAGDRTEINIAYGGMGQCDVQLFDAMAPEDGNWSIQMAATDLSACPMLRGKGVEMGTLKSTSRNIQWGGKFHPSKLADPGNVEQRWSKVGENSWRGTMMDDQHAGGGASVIHGYTLVNPRLIKGYSLFNFKIDMPPEEAAIMASMGMPMNCRSYTPFTARKN